MRISIDTAVDYLLAIPAHRSSNHGHRELGKIALEEIREYSELSENKTEKEYNKSVIAAILAAARAFSVERDRISGIWKSIDEIKARDLRLLAACRSLSPLSEKNYWAKAITVLAAIGFSFKTTSQDITGVAKYISEASPIFVLFLIITLVILEISSHITEWWVARTIERKEPLEKQSKWQKMAMGRYEDFTEKYIRAHLYLIKQFFPDEKEIATYKLDSPEDVNALTSEIIKRHLFYKQ